MTSQTRATVAFDTSRVSDYCKVPKVKNLTEANKTMKKLSQIRLIEFGFFRLWESRPSESFGVWSCN